MIVKIKRARTNSWTGLKAYAGSITKLGVGIDGQGNQVTGLTKDDEVRLEDALNLDRGTLRRGSIREGAINYWTTYTVDIDDNILTLDTEVPEQELAYKVLMANRKVAKSMADLKRGAGAQAQFVIFNEEEEADKENKRGKNKRLAYNLFDEMSTNDQKNVLMLYGRPTDSTSPAVIENQLSKLIDDDPTVFLGHAKDPALKSKVFILQLVRAGILKKAGSAFADYSTDEILAYDLEGMVKYVDAKQNNTRVLQFKEALKDRV